MSTAYSSAKQKYIGNGVTTEWGFDFPIQKHSELKVYLKRSGSTQVLLEEGVDYSFVTENTIAFPIKTGEAKLQSADVLALQRESVFESEYNFSNQQRLEPDSRSQQKDSQNFLENRHPVSGFRENLANLGKDGDQNVGESESDGGDGEEQE